MRYSFQDRTVSKFGPPIWNCDKSLVARRARSAISDCLVYICFVHTGAIITYDGMNGQCVMCWHADRMSHPAYNVTNPWTRCNMLRCSLTRLSGLQCFNMGHSGHGINLYVVVVILMENSHVGGQSIPGHLSLVYRNQIFSTIMVNPKWDHFV